MEHQIWTIGHSNKPYEEFLRILQAHHIQLLADVRRFPGSAKYPQFNQEFLLKELAAAGIEYLHFPSLGGRRKPLKDSKNTAWRNDAFKGYADFMETEEFYKAFLSLNKVSDSKNTAMMCSEILWWRCHRSLISDLFKSKGKKVIHILSEVKVQEHPYTSAAHIVNGNLSYGSDQLNIFR